MEPERSSRRYLYFAAVTVNLSAFVCGIACAWTSPVIPKLKEDPARSLTIEEESWIGSALALGAILGCLLSGLAVDKFGRKRTLLLAVALLPVAFALAAAFETVPVFLLMRLTSGLTCGAVFTVLPIYVGEIAQDDIRGRLGSFMVLFVNSGLVFSYAVGPFVSVRTFNLICFVVPMLFLALFSFVPETPYYLLGNNDVDGAKSALTQLRSGHYREKDFETIRETVDDSQKKSHLEALQKIFNSRVSAKALMLAVCLVTFQQLSGVTAITFYTQDIFAAANTSLPAEVGPIISGTVLLLTSMATSAVIDIAGKRALLMISGVGMCASEALLGYCFFSKDTSYNLGHSWLPILAFMGFNIFYCAGFGPIPWAVLGEIFPEEIKSTASTVATVACWTFAFLMTKFFGAVVLYVGIAGSFWFFAACAAAGALFVYFFVPETSGKSLQQIQELL